MGLRAVLDGPSLITGRVWFRKPPELRLLIAGLRHLLVAEPHVCRRIALIAHEDGTNDSPVAWRRGLDFSPQRKRPSPTSTWEPVMDADYRELARRLFVLAAEILEDAHPIAMRGQSTCLGAKGYLDHAERLAEAARRLYSVVDAIGAVCGRRASMVI